MTGLQDFMALRELNIRGHSVQELDLSSNLELLRLFCENNGMTNLDVTKNELLTYLYCANNVLSELNVSQNTVLERLLASLLTYDVRREFEYSFRKNQSRK